MTRSIDVTLDIDAPVEDVYKALTEADELVRWFPLEAGEHDDGTVWMSWDGDTKFAGEVAASEPPHHVRFVYRQPPPARDPKTLTDDDLVEIATDYRIESKGGKTVLRLVHSGFGDGSQWDELFDATRLGWAFELRGLKHYLENHRGQDRLVAWAKAAYPGSREQAWARLMSADGLGELGRLSAGERYSTTALGDELSGEVRFIDEPTSFVATVDGWNNAFLRVKLEDLYGLREANVWLSAYGVPKSDVDALQERWQSRLDRLFSE